MQAGTPEMLYRHPADLEAARFFCDLNEMSADVEHGEAVTPLGRFPHRFRGGASGYRLHHAASCPDRSAGQRHARAHRFDTIPGCEMPSVDLSVQGIEHPLRARVREKPAVGRRQDVASRLTATRFLFSQGRAPSFPATRVCTATRQGSRANGLVEHLGIGWWWR